MPEINPSSTIINGVWIQEVYEGNLQSGRGTSVNQPGTITLTRKYLLRKKGDNIRNPTQEMHQTEAYAALQSFILRYQGVVDYQTNEGKFRLWASKIDVDVDKNNYPVYRGEVSWIFDPKKLNYIVNPVQWSHRMSGGTRKVAFPMYPQRHYPRPGLTVRTHVGVNWNNAESVYEGVDCLSPEWTITAKQQLLSSLVTGNYLRVLYSMAKTTNSTPFRGFPPGEVLYVGAELDEATQSVSDMEFHVTNITHQFIVEPNMENFFFDDIPIDFKGGHEYLWISTAVVSEEEEQVHTMPTQINIAPMYGVSDLNLLGLG